VLLFRKTIGHCLSPHWVWLVGVSFVLFQFFLQLSSGVVIGAVMAEMTLSALTAGLLSGAFYIIYTALQIPVGILFDRYPARLLLTTNALLCSVGCFVFASSHSLFWLFVGRVLMGTGSAFAFIGLSHVLRQKYPLKQFAFMMGLSETLAFIATVIGMLALGALVATWGWRNFIHAAGAMGVLIAYLCWKHIADNTKKIPKNQGEKQSLRLILTNGKAWINGLFVGLNFTVVTAFGALWAIPFLQVKLHCNLQDASTMSALFFLGTGLSCPLFGWLSARLSKRRPLILSSCISTTIFMLVVLYLPSQSHTITSLFMFMVGLCCGAYMLAYTIANELAPANSLSTCTGFTNTLAVITTPLVQPLIGYFLDAHHPTGAYELKDYQHALLIIPASLLFAGVLVFFLPEKRGSH
jgi:MFS family permease